MSKMKKFMLLLCDSIIFSSFFKVVHGTKHLIIANRSHDKCQISNWWTCFFQMPMNKQNQFLQLHILGYNEKS